MRGRWRAEKPAVAVQIVKVELTRGQSFAEDCGRVAPRGKVKVVAREIQVFDTR